MKNRRLQPTVIIVLVILVSAFSLPAHASGSTEEQNASPFLIVGKLPHFSKLLMQQWESPELNLSPEQKEQLLVVRKETMSAVKQISPKVSKLEIQIVEGSRSGKDLEELQSLVQELADLKAEATQMHLRCIHNTQKILTPQQLQLLE